MIFRRSMPCTLVAAALVLGAMLPHCALAKVTVTAQLQNNVLRVGDKTVLQINVSTEGERISELPTLPTIDGLNFIYKTTSNSSQRFTIVNGRTTASYQAGYLYEVYAVKEGKYTISDVSVTSDSGSVKADPLEITVFPGAQPIPTRSPMLSTPQGSGNLNVYLLADASKKEVYKGEEVILSYDAVYHQQWKRWIDEAIYFNKEYAGINEEKGALKNFLSETIDLKFKNDAKPVRMAGNRDLFFQKPLRRYILYPLTPGDYSLVPMTVELALPLQRVTQFTVKPEVLEVKVKPLPEEGKPDIFEGAVGTFNLKVEAEPTELAVGETITLKVTLDGIGNIKNAPKPVLPDLSKFDQFDPTQQENISITESGMRGQINYSYVLIPHDVNSSTIGPVRYAYFDPNLKKYEIKESQPIALTILPPSGGGARAPGSAAFNRRLITRVGDDFRFIVTAPSGVSTVVLAVYKSTFFWIFTLLPALLLSLAAAWKWRAEFLAARPTVAKSIKAPRLARKLLADARKAMENNDGEAAYVNLSKAITDYIDNRFNAACAGMTGLEMKEILRKNDIDESLADSTIAILEEFDGARFSGAAQKPERIREDFSKTETLLGELMKNKRG